MFLSVFLFKNFCLLYNQGIIYIILYINGNLEPKGNTDEHVSCRVKKSSG